MNRTPKHYFESMTPRKYRKPNAPASSPSPVKKSENKMMAPQTNQQPPIKVRDKVFVLPQIQDILAKLNFNSFQPFPFEEVEEGRDRLNYIYKSMKEKSTPGCLLHGERLNLYCEKDKELVCVDCIYKDQKHKGHSIVPLDRVIMGLQFETIRTQEKVQVIIDKLL
jgi:hypothetical protein